MIETLRDTLWGPPLLLLFASTGLWYMLRLGRLQVRCLAHSCQLLFHKPDRAHGEISGFQALMTSLAGSVGTGSVAGMATALSLGGPGALFWVWVTAVLCMSIGYAEAFLGVRYRTRTSEGETVGGAMYVLERGLGSRFLAASFALCGVFAAFGIGSTVQAHSVANALESTYSISPLISGMVMLALTGLVVLGGIRSIGRVAGWIVPIMGAVYTAAALWVLVTHAVRIPEAFAEVFSQAFTGSAVLGGSAGGGLLATMRIGAARSVFCSEAGMGSGSIAASSAQTEHPAQQAMLQMLGVFLSTCVICTLTGLVICVSDAGIGLEGSSRVLACFSETWEPLRHIVVIGLILFAYSTTLAWAYYGEKCIQYLWGARIVPAFRWIYTLTVVIGVVTPIGAVWAYADIANGLMAIPNLIAVLALSSVVITETRSYFDVQTQVARA